MYHRQKQLRKVHFEQVRPQYSDGTDSWFYDVAHQRYQQNIWQSCHHFQWESTGSRISRGHYLSKSFSLQMIQMQFCHWLTALNRPTVRQWWNGIQYPSYGRCTSLYLPYRPNYLLKFLQQTLSSEQVPSQGTTQAEGLEVSSSFSFLQNNSIRYLLPPTADTPEKIEGLTGKDRFAGRG